MNTLEVMRFAKKMRTYLGLFWIGTLVLVVGFIGLLTSGSLVEQFDMLIAVACIGFGAITIGSMGRAASRCPQCGHLFCGNFEDGSEGSASVFTSSCRHCGFRANREP